MRKIPNTAIAMALLICHQVLVVSGSSTRLSIHCWLGFCEISAVLHPVFLPGPGIHSLSCLPTCILSAFHLYSIHSLHLPPHPQHPQSTLTSSSIQHPQSELSCSGLNPYPVVWLCGKAFLSDSLRHSFAEALCLPKVNLFQLSIWHTSRVIWRDWT